MVIFIGSTNPIKINAVKQAAGNQWPQAEIKNLEVDSGVKSQPDSDAETKQGAINRARRVLQQGLAGLKSREDKEQYLGVGLEGGVRIDQSQQMWTTVWAAVVDQSQQAYLANGARFQVDPVVAAAIRQGREMGPIVSNLLDGRPIKKQEGYIGVVTNNFVDRTEEYSSIAKLALGLWYGRDWQQTVQSLAVGEG